MKVALFLTLTLIVVLSMGCSNQQRDNLKGEVQSVDKKVQKRDGYCSPLDKALNNKCAKEE